MLALLVLLLEIVLCCSRLAKTARVSAASAILMDVTTGAIFEKSLSAATDGVDNQDRDSGLVLEQMICKAGLLPTDQRHYRRVLLYVKTEKYTPFGICCGLMPARTMPQWPWLKASWQCQ